MKTIKQGDLVLQKISDEIELKDAKPAFDYEFKRKIHKPLALDFLFTQMKYFSRDRIDSSLSDTINSYLSRASFKCIGMNSIKKSGISFKKFYLRESSLGILSEDLK